MKKDSTGRIHLVDFGRSPRVDADVHVNRMQRPKRYLLRMLLNICIPEPAESCVFNALSSQPRFASKGATEELASTGWYRLALNVVSCIANRGSRFTF